MTGTVYEEVGNYLRKISPRRATTADLEVALKKANLSATMSNLFSEQEWYAEKYPILKGLRREKRPTGKGFQFFYPQTSQQPKVRPSTSNGPKAELIMQPVQLTMVAMLSDGTLVLVDDQSQFWIADRAKIVLGSDN